jgi:hypothetical protein
LGKELIVPSHPLAFVLFVETVSPRVHKTEGCKFIAVDEQDQDIHFIEDGQSVFPGNPGFSKVAFHEV